MDVSVIIVNYNTVELTIQCINSIYKHTKDITFELIVVDNASTDNSVKLLTDMFPKLTIIKNKENIGFGRANNIGINVSKGKYLFLLNSDTILLNNAIELFFNFIEKSNLKIGALGCIMLDCDLKLNYKNSFNFFPGTFYLINNYFKKFKTGYDYYDKELLGNGMFSVDFIVGADLFLSSDVIHKIGNFDSDFFLYWEEVDLQYRMSKLNYKRLIISGPEIIHLEGGSSQKAFNNWKRIIHDKHLIIYAKKNFKAFHFNIFKIIIVLRHLITFFDRKFTKKEQWEYLKAICKS
jgi:GT2 family glycosyltransferase